MSGPRFSAADASLGYAYQVRIALLRALQYARAGVQFDVAIETLDDVSFSTTGDAPFELLQLKHSLRAKAGLSDSSPDLWKTLRIWCTKWRAGNLELGVKLFLVSTSIAADGSAAACLRSGCRDRETPRALLDAAASTSMNKDNLAAYEAWKALSPIDQISLLEQIEVLDGAPTIADLEEQLLEQLWGFAESSKRPTFLEYLEGWWFRRVLRQLARVSPPIPVAELEAQLDRLREQFRMDSLPIDEDLLSRELDAALVGSYRSHVFVRQMELIKARASRIGIAIREYFRAYEQRSKWVRQDLVLDVELRGYERQLIEEWELTREQLFARLGNEATESTLQEVGLQLLTWAENNIIPIRTGVTTPFVSRGSFHMLADEQRIGWHPHFRELLARVLAAPSESVP
ncbi:hypothetical protein GCM10011487_69710 [Steroidobacter agaridevorans]|uniref:ABC-three component systems C-terminal domain-containing protein n=1 Tax=Steroidobacter agaridevorans TaxID=2695856 RepID=A0A829YPN4_9GAMM|nr:ABC-three component system protein [Steroidobacter agaridevorans]GFE84971.1 hypothetical protein GCM10011487_69710 [Steroidobacter agaridevorans]